MNDLSQMVCEPCRVGSAPLSAADIQELILSVPGWVVRLEGGVNRLTREFKFKNFAESLLFTRLVGDLAEANGHHPRIVTQWGRVEVEWWTHKIGGLHKSDFIMAAKTDAVLKQLTAGQTGVVCKSGSQKEEKT